MKLRVLLDEEELRTIEDALIYHLLREEITEKSRKIQATYLKVTQALARSYKEIPGASYSSK